MKIEIHYTDERGNFARTLFPQKFVFRGKTFVVPKGFDFDGASVPRIFRVSVCAPLDPEAARGGCAHDWIYRTQPKGWTRATADLMFLCFLIEDGMPVHRALKAYIGVRIGGWIAWRENRCLLESGAVRKFEEGDEK